MAETTLNSGKAWSPDVTAFAPVNAVENALILNHSTNLGSIEGDEPAVRVAYVDDAAATFFAEGATISEADPALSEVLVYTGKIAQLIRLSREQFVTGNTATEMSASVSRAITKKADEAFLAQVAPTSPAVTPPAGVLNVTGIETGGAVTASLDALIDLVATLEANGSVPTGIIIDPVGWASLMKLKTATGANTGLLGAGTNDAQRMLLDLPVTVSAAMSANTGLVIDKSAIVSALGTVNVATSDQVFFNSDSIGLRATWRIGHNIVKPERIGSFTVDDGVA